MTTPRLGLVLGGLVVEIVLGRMFVGATMAHYIRMSCRVLVFGQVGQREQLLWVLLQQIHPAGNGAREWKRKR